MNRSKIVPAAGLFVLAPVCAEYLVGYDSSTGDPLELLGGLTILAPLYGGAALIIREMARHHGVGWLGMISWAAAFGVLEAGWVDHSLFNMNYRDISYWQEITQPTFIPALGMSGYTTLVFVLGHVVGSICAPIVVVESLAGEHRDTPWLGRIGLAITTMLYVAASALVLVDHVRTEQFVPSAAQLLGTGVAVVSLIIAGWWLGRRGRFSVGPAVPGSPSPWLVGLAAFVLGMAFNVVPPTWLGTALGVLIVAAAATGVVLFSRSDGWTREHVLALAGGALLASAAMGFVVEPIGDVPLVAKLAHNSVAALGVAALTAVAARVLRRGCAPRPRISVRTR